MILNGKAKRDFLDFYWSNYIGKTRFFSEKENTEDFFKSLYPILKDALIIEWFDSVGIYISVFKDFEIFEIYINDDWLGGEETRKKATEKATEIATEIANEIYNIQ